MRKITGWLCLAAAGILFLTAGVFSWEESKNAGSCQEVSTVTEEDENYIKWVEFHVTDAVLDKALSCDIDTYGESSLWHHFFYASIKNLSHVYPEFPVP